MPRDANDNKNDEIKFEQSCKGDEPIVDVVFLHGLTGDQHKTWQTSDGSGSWMQWLDSEIGRINVYAVGYPASLLEKWAKKEMDPFERASNLLEQFANVGIGKRPLVFVAHSLGGILVKMILRKSCEASDASWRAISEVTELVAFLATPHTGSDLANILNLLPGHSKSVALLANHFGALQDLNEHYKGFADGKEDLQTIAYYEKHRTAKVLIVPRESADPGVSKCSPVAVDKNHIDICKPADQNDIVYLGVKRRIQLIKNSGENFRESSVSASDEEFYSEKSDLDRRTLLQKLIDSGRENEYPYANDAQNRFARRYTKTGLLAAARSDHDNFLSEIETRFIAHVYHPLICKGLPDEDIRTALQTHVLDSLANKMIGGSHFSAKDVLSGLYFLTEQCHLRWDPPK